MPRFEKGMRLCEGFFQEAVKPVLEGQFPDLAYSAGRLDTGSEVLGFDTPQSMDHGWGLQVILFVPEIRYACGGETTVTPYSGGVPVYHYDLNQQTGVNSAGATVSGWFLTTGLYHGTPGGESQ